MPPLSTELRRLLKKKVVEARDAAEAAAAGALRSLAVDRSEPFPAMGESDRELRRILRARARVLGDFREPLADSAGFALLIQETAYEHWHRMLFARFLSENGLLMHPEHGVAVTLEECAELAPQEGEPDEWMLAARYASEMLPGIFRTDDPVPKIRFAPEGCQALESILAELPPSLFLADDSLGWVYQFWQAKKKAEVNKSERKIGGADLAPVTQLFTEHYMVAFLLENSLGAWWAGKHPESPLLKEWEYLRYLEDGTPAAGTFEGWPKTVAEVTMMDPCCGSGHFLVAAFQMLQRMREEEEGLSPKDAADAVLRDNLFGLELDGRCVQIAVFALALAAWRVGGCHQLPPMNVACCGVPARGTAEEWRQLARNDMRLADALERLHYLFKDADTLGSLIDPRRAAEADRLTGVGYEEVAPLLHKALSRYGGDDPAQQVFAHAVEEVATAAKLLAGGYTLVATNVPYLKRGNQTDVLRSHNDRFFSLGNSDVATAMLLRALDMLSSNGTTALVSQQHWRFQDSYSGLRKELLNRRQVIMLPILGPGAFETIGGEFVNVALVLISASALAASHEIGGLDVSGLTLPRAKADALRTNEIVWINQLQQLKNPGARIIFGLDASGATLRGIGCRAYQGLATGDYKRFGRYFWEVVSHGHDWCFEQSTVEKPIAYGGRQRVVLWEEGRGQLAHYPNARVQGLAALGKMGIAVSQMGQLPCTLFSGTLFDNNTAALVPPRDDLLPALWAFADSGELSRITATMNPTAKVTNAAIEEVPFDLDHWTKVAREKYPNGLPEPHSDDPTQWLFNGSIVGSESPLHVAAARLLGYRWPDQEESDLDRFSDSDGIVCLPSAAGERPGADRMFELLAAAYGDAWNQSVMDSLLASEGASELSAWLRDGFFSSHCKLFHHRPFIWHIWDGRKDGFAALINYHKLDRKLLERLIYTTLQSWIDRQKAEAAQGIGGTEARLVAAIQLKEKLQLILAGEPPYDIHVRWKALATQPIGWDPDIDDGVRLNSRPFVTAGVFRAKFNVKWAKDQGKNSDGSVRLNDLHHTIAEKLAARGQEGGK